MSTIQHLDDAAAGAAGLEDSGDPYRLLFELNPQPAFVCDAESLQFLAVNDAAAVKYGYTRQEFLSLSWERILAEDPEGSRPRNNGRPDATSGIWRHRAKAGTAFEVELQSRGLRFQSRDAKLIVGQDVTTRRQAETILSTRYALTRLLTESGVECTSKALRCLCESLGFDGAELWTLEPGSDFLGLQSWWHPGVSGEWGDCADLRIAARMGEGTVPQVWAGGGSCWISNLGTEPGYRERPAAEGAGGIAFAVRSHGSVTGVAVLLSRRQDPADRHILPLLADVGAQLGEHIERCRVDQELRKAEDSLRAFFADAPVPYHEMDASGVITRVNQAECAILGYQPAEMIGKPVWDFVAPEEREECRGAVTWRLERRYTSPPIERRYRTRNGGDRVFRVHARLIIGPAGEVIGIRSAMLDLTEARRTRQQIEFQTGLLDQVQDAILTVDREFRIAYCNGAAARMFGWGAEEAVGQPYRMVAGTVVTQAERESIHAEILERGRWSNEIMCTNRSGKQFVVHVSWSVIRDSRGEIQAIVGLHRDLTERRRIEQALRASEDRLQLAQDTLGVGTWEWGFGPGMPKCSDQLLRLYGLPGNGDGFTFDQWASCVHPDDRARAIAEVERHRERRESFESQFRVVWPDGSVHWLLDRAMVVADNQGQAASMVGIAFDITEQKMVERANAELAAIVECADSAIISSDLAGLVQTWNRGAERIFGYSAQEMVGKSISSMIPPDRVAELAAITEKLRRGESVNHLETSRLTKCGKPLPVLLTISPIRDRDGTVLGAAHVALDITQIKQLERQLAQAQKLESIGQLAAGIAHEINTPIQYIGDNGKFLEDAFQDLVRFAEARQRAANGAGVPEKDAALLPAAGEDLEQGVLEYLRVEIPKAIQQLLEGVEHVARIVRAMKEFSHPGPVEKMPVDINRAIESTILVSKNEWKYVAEVTTDLEAELPPVPCLAGEFNQVILNLIVNAAHAIAEVVQDSGSRGAIHISTRRAGNAVEIRVRDTGCGIPEAIQPKIFDPFFTTKVVGKGTGQGLSIAHSVIVQKHAGTIQFETEPGRGTTFIIHLPLDCELRAL